MIYNYEKELSKLVEELKNNSGYVSVLELVDRFVDIDNEYNHEPWNLLQILANINMVTTVNSADNSKWIPCSERLPEIKDGEYCSDCVLVTLKWWDGELSETIGWYNNTGIWNEDGKMCKVIAWMPYEPYRQT